MSTASEAVPIRPADMAECSEVVAQLRAGRQYALLIATEHMTRLSVGWRPPTARQVRHQIRQSVGAVYSLWTGHL